MRDDDRVAQVLRTGRRAAGLQVDHVERRDRRLDGVQRRQHPGANACPRGGVARHQRLGALAQVHDDGAGLEQHQAVVVDRRHLAERLHCAIGGRLLVVGADQHHLVGDARLLERPAHAQVAHQPLGERRNPAKGAEADHDFAPASAVGEGVEHLAPALAVACSLRLGRERLLAKGEQRLVRTLILEAEGHQRRPVVRRVAAVPLEAHDDPVRRLDDAVHAVRRRLAVVRADGEAVGAAFAEVHLEARGREALRMPPILDPCRIGPETKDSSLRCVEDAAQDEGLLGGGGCGDGAHGGFLGFIRRARTCGAERRAEVRGLLRPSFVAILLPCGRTVLPRTGGRPAASRPRP